VSRAARGCPWTARLPEQAGQFVTLIGRSRTPVGKGVFVQRIMAAVTVESMVGGAIRKK
jgi:hypothetical protein